MRWPIWRVAVAERSMEPALRPGDWLLVWRGMGWRGTGWLGRAKVRPGRVVVARHPERPDLLLVKRAVWREADLWWLTSDNPRAGAVDSARFGPVPAVLIEGRVLLRYRRAKAGGPTPGRG
jgi:nickel-type superoxide dismutase maturation protease